MEVELSKQKQKCFKLENDLRKAEIKFDEEIYNKKWMGGNFEKEQLHEQIAELEKELEENRAKHKKEKERRNVLEKRVLELEEGVGLWNVKAETYELENRNLVKKCKKIEKKMAITKENADQQAADSLSWQEKFLKSVSISEELISRVKRDLIGDAVTLAKSCEYKLNKLKEEEKAFNKVVECPSKSPSSSKKRSKSRNFSRGLSPGKPVSRQEN